MCVGNCKDPFVTYLKSYGYNTIRLPRANIRPLQLLVESKKELTWMGDIADVFVAEPGTALPLIDADAIAGNIAGQRTSEMSIGVGLSILGNVIGAMGGSKLGLDTAYKSAKSAVFEFSDVLSDTVSAAKLDQFLGASDVNPNSVTIGRMLEADQIYVVTSTLKSRKVNVEGKQSSGGSASLDVPVIQQIVGGNVKVSAAGSASGTITYEGPVPLVFGFQAVRLYYENGAYTAFKPLDAGAMSARALDHVVDDGTDLLMTESTFVPVGA
jgi:hypothetical protein